VRSFVAQMDFLPIPSIFMLPGFILTLCSSSHPFRRQKVVGGWGRNFPDLCSGEGSREVKSPDRCKKLGRKREFNRHIDRLKSERLIQKTKNAVGLVVPSGVKNIRGRGGK